MKEGQFCEVIIDAKSGSLEQVEPLIEPDEVEDAKDQSAAMGKAKNPLDVAVRTAEDENSGYRAVSVMPMLNAGGLSLRLRLIEILWSDALFGGVRARTHRRWSCRGQDRGGTQCRAWSRRIHGDRSGDCSGMRTR